LKESDKLRIAYVGIMGELQKPEILYHIGKNIEDVEIYFIDYERYFGRDGIYVDENGDGYKDNGERFVFLSKAALMLAKMLHFTPDIIHANDWHTASMPIIAKTRFKYDFANAKTVLTIHNLQHQGVFDKALIDIMEIGWEHFTPYEFESHNRVNLLKGGIATADAITTVSKKYALEIQTPEFGFGLDYHIMAHSYKLNGILNGVDYDEWNPSIDPYIALNYDFDTLENKIECKRDLQKVFNFHKEMMWHSLVLLVGLHNKRV
jgi:starch synthase